MKNVLFIMMMLLAAFSLASAKKMSVGAGYSQGFGTGEDQVGTLFGAYFQYDFNEWLSGRGGVGSLSSNMHKEFDQLHPDTPLIHRRLTRLSAHYLTFLYRFLPISVQRMASFTLDRVTSPQPRQVKANYTESDTGDNYNVDITKQTIAGISLTMGGKANITDSFFAYGEAFFVNSYQGEYEYETDTLAQQPLLLNQVR